MKTEILAPTPQNIARAADILRADGVVGMPTETVYGLAGKASSIPAITRIFQTKERPTFDPLIVHVAPKPALKFSTLEYLAELGLIPEDCFPPSIAERINILCASYWPGPLTLVLPRTPNVPDLATSGLPTVAIRVPAHPIAQALLKETGFPLAAPSANRFGRISPTSAPHVKRELEGRVSVILDGGKCAIGIESTVLRIDPSGTLRLLRPGGTPIEKIEKMLGSKVTRSSATQDTTGSLAKPAPSPGMLESHYAPTKPLYVLPASTDQISETQIHEIFKALAPIPGPVGILLFSPHQDLAVSALAKALGRSLAKLVLTPLHTPEEAARNLFHMMRKLDESAAVALMCEPCPWTDGLGYAITDRLTRASSKTK